MVIVIEMSIAHEKAKTRPFGNEAFDLPLIYSFSFKNIDSETTNNNIRWDSKVLEFETEHKILFEICIQ